jgi:hypothetical protein
LTDSFDPVLWGLEEEGIPYEIREVSDGPMVDLAKQAADGSPLNVGISVGRGREVILHHHDLPNETPLFSVAAEPWRPLQLRHLGMNAARLVKGQSLVFANENSSLIGAEASLGTPQDESKGLIHLIVDEILKDYAEKFGK